MSNLISEQVCVQNCWVKKKKTLINHLQQLLCQEDQTYALNFIKQMSRWSNGTMLDRMLQLIQVNHCLYYKNEKKKKLGFLFRLYNALVNAVWQVLGTHKTTASHVVAGDDKGNPISEAS